MRFWRNKGGIMAIEGHQPVQFQPLMQPSTKSVSTEGTTPLRKQEMGAPPQKTATVPPQGREFGGDQHSLSVLNHLSSASKNDTFFLGDARDFLRNRGTDGLYVLNGPKDGNGAQKTYVFYKSDTIVLHKEFDPKQSIDELNHEFEQLKPSQQPGRQEPSEAVKKRIAEAESKAVEQENSNKADVVVNGGSGTRDANAIAKGSAKRSVGFFSYVFGKIKKGAETIQHEIKGAKLSLQKNLKNAFPKAEGKESKTSASRSPEPDAARVEPEKAEMGSPNPVKAAQVEEPLTGETAEKFQLVSQQVETLKTKFINVSVANKNLKPDDPRRQEFLDKHVSGAIEEAQTALREINDLKSQVENNPTKKKELEQLEKGMNQAISVLKSIKGEPRVSQLNSDQKRALELLNIDIKVRTADQTKELANLINKMNEAALVGIVDEQAMVCFESPISNASLLNPLAIGGKLKGTLEDGHPCKVKDPQEWVNLSPIGRIRDKERAVYHNTYAGLSQAAKVQEEGYVKAKEGTMKLYGEVLGVMAPGTTIDDCIKAREDALNNEAATIAKEIEKEGKTPKLETALKSIADRRVALDKLKQFVQTQETKDPLVILKVLLEQQETIITQSNQKDKIAEQSAILGSLISSFSSLIAEKTGDLKSEEKDAKKLEIQQRIPQFKTAVYENSYNNDGALSFHGLDKILHQLKMPTSYEGIMGALKSTLEAREKLAQNNPSNIGIQM